MPTSAPGIAREHLEAFLTALSDRVSPATVAKHYRSLQQLFRWLVEDGEIGHSPMERMRPPAVPEQPVDILTDDELRALLDEALGLATARAGGIAWESLFRFDHGAPPWITPGVTWSPGTDFVTVDGMPAVHFSGLTPTCTPL